MLIRKNEKAGWRYLRRTLIVSAALSIISLACRTNQGQEKENVQIKYAQEVKEMIEKWAPTIILEDRIELDTDKVYTAELQELLSGFREQNILAFLAIQDVVKESNGSYVALFAMNDILGEPRISFLLSIKEGTFRKILKAQVMDLMAAQKFAVLFRVSDTSTPRHDLIANGSLPLFTGECLDAVFTDMNGKKDLL